MQVSCGVRVAGLRTALRLGEWRQGLMQKGKRRCSCQEEEHEKGPNHFYEGETPSCSQRTEKNYYVSYDTRDVGGKSETAERRVQRGGNHLTKLKDESGNSFGNGSQTFGSLWGLSQDG